MSWERAMASQGYGPWKIGKENVGWRAAASAAGIGAILPGYFFIQRRSTSAELSASFWTSSLKSSVLMCL